MNNLNDLGESLLRYNLKDKKFIVFDFEVVEGLNLFFSRPHQLSWLEFNGNNLLNENNFYLKWETPFRISEGAARVTRFRQEIIDENGQDPKEVFSKFSKYINAKDYFIVGSNTLGYDTMIYYNSMKRLGLNHDYNFLKRCYDVNALFKAYKLGRKVDNNNLLPFQLSANAFVQKGLKSNVGYMAKEFGIEIDENKAHEALYDCLIESKIFFEIINRIEIN